MAKLLIPMGSNITVEKGEPVTMTPGGIALPESVHKTKEGALTKGKVVAVGEGVRNFYGQKYAPEVKSGEYVLYKDYSGSEFKDTENPDKTYVILREADVLGVFRDV